MKFLTKILAALALITTLPAPADNLVILHTNDTHSQIDPADNGLGGVARRKVIIDSVRALNPNVLLIDAGDAVQGTMYFTIYKGEVEYRMLDELGYDIAIVGNHDFDNGAEALARNLSKSSATWLSANYDFSNAPGLDSIFLPAVIKEYGDKRVGVFGINLVPEGMIAKGNYNGVVYRDAVSVADSVASGLRDRGADYVVAVTHIGYDGEVKPTDSSLAADTKGIDLIIGSHSHSLIEPANSINGRFHWKHLNAAGDTVAVVQAGSRGANVGMVTLDLDNGNILYDIIPVDSRLDASLDPRIVGVISRYGMAVDSIMNINIASTARKLGKDDAGLVNFLGDFVAHRGQQLSNRDIDFALINAGGVRRELPQGSISKGMIIDMLPFNNRVVVLDISGADLLEAVNGIIRRGGFDGVNKDVRIVFNPESKECVTAQIRGSVIEPTARYTMATIDYLANGGDYMTSLPNAVEIARSNNVLYDDLIDYIETYWGEIPLDASPQRRITATDQ